MSHPNLSLPTRLAAIFGTGTEINVHVVEDGRVTFYNSDTRNLWETVLPDAVIFGGTFNGPGRYTMAIKGGEIDSLKANGVEVPERAMKSVQFEENVDEAVGSPESGAALSVIFRQLLKDNDISEQVMSERLDALLDKFPSPSLGREGMKNYVMTQLVETKMTWEAFAIGMKIVGATTIIIAVR